MKVLTLTQPWATLVAIGAKKLETRSWRTGYRGPLLIHAAMGFPRAAKEMCFERLFAETMAQHGIRKFGEIPTGVIVARVELVDCFRTEDVQSAETESAIALRGEVDWDAGNERHFGDYSPNRFAWLMRNVRATRHVAAKGALGLWTPTAELIEALS